MKKNMKVLCENVTSIFETVISRKRDKVCKVKFPVNHFNYAYSYSWYVLGSGSNGKESACNAGDPSSIPGSGRSPGEGNGNRSSILAWEIPWTEEPGGLLSMGSQGVGHNWATNTDTS